MNNTDAPQAMNLVESLSWSSLSCPDISSIPKVPNWLITSFIELNMEVLGHYTMSFGLLISYCGKRIEEPEIQKLQMQAKIFKENSLNKLNALNITIQHLSSSNTQLPQRWAQSDNLRLYEITYDIMIYAMICPNGGKRGRDSDSLEKEVGSIDKDNVNPYDYTYQKPVFMKLSNPIQNYFVQLERAIESKVCECLHKCLAQKLSKQTESVNNEVHNKLLKSFAKLEKYSISLDLYLQHCKEQMKINPVCKENALNVFRKEREKYYEIQDLKAQMQDKNIAISELKKLIENCKGKSVETQFNKPSVVRQPNAQRIPKPSVLGKPTPFSNSPEMRSFQTKQSVNKTNVSDGLFKQVTQQNLPQIRKQAVRNTNVIAPGPSRNCPKHVSHQSPREKVGSNDMVHNYYLEKAKKSAQLQKDKEVNGKPSMIDPARLPNTANGCKPKPRNWQASMSSRVSNKDVHLGEHRKQKPFLKFNDLQCPTCKKCLYSANHDECVLEYLSKLNPRASAQIKDAKSHNTTKRYVPVEKTSESKKPERLIPKGHRFSHKKTTTVPEKTMNPRSCLRWKPTGRIFSNVRLRWIPTGKLLNSCTGKVDSEPAHGLIVDIPHIHACKQTLGLSAGTSFNGQKQQRIDLNADALYNEKQENLRVWLLKFNFVEKFSTVLTVRFGNDQFAPILGYGDLNQGNVTIKQVYYVEGLNHNLFLVSQFCDTDLEVAFWKSTCFVRDLQGNDLLTASPTQAWLWHRRLSHLNFNYITLLSKKEVVTGLPKNALSKRRTRTLVEAARTMLSASKLPLSFWAKAVATACYTQNRSIIISTHGKTTYHTINDRKPSIKHLYIFGCICYITRDGENLDKMKEKRDPCVMVGYSTQSKGYLVYNKRTRLIVESIHIKFDEIKEMMTDHNSSDLAPQQQEMSVENVSSSLLPQGQKASDYDNSDPVPPRQNVVPIAEKTDSSQQGLEFLFSPLLEEYYNPTHGLAEKNNNDQAPNASFHQDDFFNPFYTRVQEIGESFSRNIDNTDVHSFQPQSHDY
ncbi:integrase, catalytic region, zinc finger, CCHC-type containing protein [Tanacetum coccineum]